MARGCRKSDSPVEFHSKTDIPVNLRHRVGLNEAISAPARRPHEAAVQHSPDVTAYIQRDGVLVRKRGGNSLFVPVIIVRERVSYIMYYILINIF